MLFRSPLARRHAIPATRATPYAPPPGTPPSYGQVQLNPAYSGATSTPVYSGSVGSTGAASAVNPASGATPTANISYEQVAQVLGQDSANAMQAAANAGNWTAYNEILKRALLIISPGSAGE